MGTANAVPFFLRLSFVEGPPSLVRETLTKPVAPRTSTSSVVESGCLNAQPQSFHRTVAGDPLIQGVPNADGAVNCRAHAIASL